MRSRWIVFLPAACLAFFSAPAGASDLITISVEQPSVLLPILAGDFEVIAHSDRDCSVLEVDPFLELLDPSGAVMAADDDGWHRQGDCLASRLAGVAGDGFSIRVSGCCGRPYGVIRLEWLSGGAPESAPSTAVSVPETLPEATSTLPAVSTTLEMSEPSVTLPASTVLEPATTVALEVTSTTVLEVPIPTEPATTLPAPTTSEVISWPTTTIPDRPTATAVLPDPVVSTSVQSSTTVSTLSPDPTTTVPTKVPPPIVERDLFDGTHDDVVPEGSTISIAQRRTVVAVSAVFFIAAPRPSSGGNGSSRRRR
jgi:hypothetical protein